MHITNRPSAMNSAAGLENVSRRKLLQGLGITGGLVLAAPLLPKPALAAYNTGAGAMPHGVVVDPKIFIAVAPDGTVTIVAHRSEMGTGVRTSLPMIVADEMGADWSRVKVVQAPGDEAKYGNQDTDGSRSTRHYLIPMRQMGAAARTMLEAAAAKRWGVPVSQVKAVNHEVVDQSGGRRIGFGDLASDAAAEPVPNIASLKLKDPKDFRYMGKGNGRHRRSPRHHHRHGGIWRRPQPARNEVCGGGPPSGGRRQARLVRRQGRARRSGRREGNRGARAGPGRPSSSRSAASRSLPATRVPRSRGGTRSRSSGRTAPTPATIRLPIVRNSKRRRANPAPWCGTTATWMRR